LLEQWASAFVRTVDDGGSFHVQPGPQTPDASVLHRVPTEGEFEDLAGAIHVLLHVVEGRMAEVEIYHSAGGRVRPSFDLERLTVWQPETWPRDLGWS
jgi:hypothetical protein